MEQIPFISARIAELESTMAEKKRNIARLQAQRNDLNKQVRDLKDEIFHLLENPSDVDELVRKVGKNRALVSNNHEGKYLVMVEL